MGCMNNMVAPRATGNFRVKTQKRLNLKEIDEKSEET